MTGFSCLHVGTAAVHSVSLGRDLRRVPSLFQLSFFLTWLCASLSAGTPRFRHVCTDGPVCTSGGGLTTLSRSSCTSGIIFSACRSRLFVVNLGPPSVLRLCPSCLRSKDQVWCTLFAPWAAVDAHFDPAPWASDPSAPPGSSEPVSACSW